MTEVDRIAVLDLFLLVFDPIEALHHAKGLLVANDRYAGIVLTEQGNRATVVGLHVVDYKIVDRTVADNFMDVLDKLREEIDLYRIDETHPVVVNEVRIVRYAVRKRPQALEERLVAVIDAHIINLVLNFFCHCAYLLRYADICLPKAGDT